MAVGRISGPLLKANLVRSTLPVDRRNLAFETDLLYIDVNNSRIGVKTTSPAYPLDVAGTIRTTDLQVPNTATINNVTISNNSITTTGNQLNLATPDSAVYNNRLLVDDLIIDGNTITATDTNQNFEIIPSGTGTVEVRGDTRVEGNIHATGNIRADGNIQIGDQDTDTITINADVASNLVPDASNTYTLGLANKRWDEVFANNLTVDNLTLTGNITVNGLDLTARPGKTYYVATNGDDLQTGTHQNDPYASLTKALSVATTGDHIHIYPGTYSEVFPMVVPVGVSLKGDGLRAVTIQPTAPTNTNDAFILNGEVTIEDLTVTGFQFDAGNNTGYAFRFNSNGDSSGYSVTSRSPYIRNVTVLTQGTVTSATDPRGFASGDAGKGAFLDGAMATAWSREAGCLFQNVTMITPGVDAVTLTNGVRVEWLNSFTYFANRSIYAYDGASGLAGQGQTNLRVSNISGTITAGETIFYYNNSGQVISSATIDSVDGNRITINGKVTGFELPPESGGKTMVTNGNAQLNTSIKKFGQSSLQLGGTADSTNTANSVDFGFGTDDFTVETWVRSNQAQTTTLFDFRANTSNDNGVQVSVVNSTPRILLNGSYVLTGTNGFNDDTWTHFALSRKNSYTKIFVNGVNSGQTRNPQTLTINGDPQVDTSTKKYGTRSVAFDGADDSIDVANTADFGFTTADFTLESWMNFTSTAQQSIFDFRTVTIENKVWLYATPTNNKIILHVNGSNIAELTGINLSTWHHVALTRQAGVGRLFLDGVLSSTFTFSQNLGATTPCRIGARYDAIGTNEFSGYMDGIRFSSTAKYTSAFTPGNMINTTDTVLMIDVEDGIVDNTNLYMNTNLASAKPLTIGNNYSNNNGFNGYLDDFRIVKGFSLYDLDFTPPTAELTRSTQTTLLLRFNGDNASTSFTETLTLPQDIRFSGGATAERFTLVDYADFGAEVRAIASASIYGNYGIWGDGEGVRMYLISHNLAYIGNGKEVSNDANTVVQVNEIVKQNDASIFFTSVDHKGDFRVGDQFYVNQETGQVDFTTSTLNIDIDQGVTFTTGADITVISGSSVETGNIKISGNTIESLTGDVTFDSNTDEINLQNNVAITGNLDVTGDITIGGNVTIGDETTDSISITAGIGSDLKPAIDNTYDLGTATKRWNTIYARELETDSVRIDNNVIQTIDSNADLELRTNGTGTVNVENFSFSGDTISNTNDITINPSTGVFRVDGTGAVKVPAGTTAERPGTPSLGMLRYNTDTNFFEGYDGNWIPLAGVSDIDQDTYITAELNPGDDDDTIRFYAAGTLVADVNSTRFDVQSLVVDNLLLQGNSISTTGTDQDLVLNANGLGTIKVEDFVFEGNTITNSVPNSPTVFRTTGDGYIDVSQAGGFVLPTGTSVDRPSTGVTGMIRYNTNDQRVELYDGTSWGSIAGSSGAVSILDATEIAIKIALTYG